MNEIVIIGSGLSGLVVGNLLARCGHHVIIVEQAATPGGCMRPFCRNGVIYETGFHFVSGLCRRTPVYRLFRQLDLLKLPWQELHELEIHIAEQTYHLPCSLVKSRKYLTQLFPHQKNQLRAYFYKLEEIAHCPLQQTLPYWEQNAWNWLSSIITDVDLLNVLSSMSLIIDLNKERLPLFSYAEIMWGILSSTKRLQGGGQTIVNHLVKAFIQAGGEVICNAAVTGIVENNHGVVGVCLASGETIDADVVVSSLHPIATMSLLSDQSKMRGIYRRRISRLESTPGCFTVNVKIKDGAYTLPNHPIYIHKANTVLWNDEMNNGNHVMIYTYPDTNAIDIMMPMAWNQVVSWANTESGHRGQDYELFKQKSTDQCIRLAETVLPHLRENIQQCIVSTPLTWHDHLLMYKGSSYGTYKDCRFVESTLLGPRTPLHGLYLTGQSLAQHGIVGTAISAFFTASVVEPKLEKTIKLFVN